VRILQVIPYYFPSTDFGGPAQVCGKLSAWLVGRGHTVTVLTTDAASRSARLSSLRDTIDGVQIIRLRNFSQRLVTQNLYTPLHCKLTLETLLATCDVVHVHDFYTWLTYRAATEARARNIPVLLSGHASLSVSEERGRIGIKQAWMAVLGKRTIAASSLVQAASVHEHDACVSAGVPLTKMSIVAQGVTLPPRAGDGASFRGRHGIGERPLLLFVGRLSSAKGVDLLLEAAQELAQHPAQPVFVLAGPPENRPDLFSGWRGKNVLLTGALDQPSLQDAYAAASAFVLPSFAEGMPVSALDALAFGLPCVISNRCNLPEVQEADAGLLVEPTLASFQRGLVRLLALRDEWSAMGRRAQALVCERFSIHQAHAKYERLYGGLLHSS
jgi:glycosyltransferase involved in cell wall biosynthesis